MTAEVDIMQRWGFLEPWFCMLRIQRMNRRQHSPFEPDQLNAHISLPAAQDEVQMTLEGLKLLAAVAHVDYSAWKKILLRHSGMTGDLWVKGTDNGSTVRFQLRIEKNDGTVDKIVQMCGVRQHDHPRREYSEALARIAAMDAKRDSKRRGVEIPVPVVVSFWEDISPVELVKLRDAERTCEWKSRSLLPVEPGGLRCTFVSEVNADLKYYEFHSIDLDVMRTMQQLIYDNVWFSQLSLRLGSEDIQLGKELFGRLITTLFGSTRRSNESSIQYWEPDNDTSRIRQQLDHLSIEPVGEPLNDIEAICSAAIHSQTVRELKLIYNTNPIDSVHWWQWIAYAFFSKRARTYSSLEGLALKNIEKMTTAEVEAFCGILTSETPEEELFGCSSANTGLQEVTLTANSPIRWDFDGESVVQSDIVQFLSPIPFVWIMSTNEQTEWVDALVPGYGRCQVLRQNLIFNDPVSATTRGNNLTALEINAVYYHRDLSGLPQFIGAVGSTLKMLTIDANHVQLEMVLEKCPNLEKLCLRKQLSTAIFNFSEYQAAGFPVPVFPFRFDDIIAFTEELMNPDSDLTKCLQRLTLQPDHGPYYENEGISIEELEALLKMLGNNGRLEHLQLKPQPRKYMYAERFRRFHLQPIDRSVKLDTQSKIAFLSLLSSTSLRQSDKRQYQTRGKRRNWEHFDANILTNVFQFAAAPLLRNVYVENRILG